MYFRVLLACLAAVVVAIPSDAAYCDWAPKNGSLPNTNAVDVGKPALFRESSMGRVYTVGGGDDEFMIAHLFGSTPFEWGVAHGTLLKDEINSLIPSLLIHFELLVEEMAKNGDLTNSTAALLKEHGLRGCLELVANWTAPYTAPAVLDELRGLAQGSGVDYDMLLHIHLFPEFIEASCSIVSAFGPATATGQLMQARALDWDVSGPLQDYPVLLVYHPTGASTAHKFMQLSWTGFIGALTGLNDASIVYGAIGVSNPDNTFGPRVRQGNPFLFLFHTLLQSAASLPVAVEQVTSAHRTMDLLVGLGDGNGTASAVGIKYSSKAADAFPPETLQPDYPWHPHKPGIVWWAMDYMCATFDTVMSAQLDRFSGNLTPADIVRDVFPIVNTGNLHVMIADYATGMLYVANARASNETGPMNAYQRQYVSLNRQDLFDEQQPSR